MKRFRNSSEKRRNSMTLPCCASIISGLDTITGCLKIRSSINKDYSIDIEGKNVLVIDDILDTGRTLAFVKDYLMVKSPKTIKLCTLLDKPERRTSKVSVDYVGFSVPDEFVVGYGLDYDEKYRNLPYIGVLRPEAYT